jgi:Na+-transporting NADH:ubiquinone oxidoreductase subunit NqrD
MLRMIKVALKSVLQNTFKSNCPSNISVVGVCDGVNVIVGVDVGALVGVSVLVNVGVGDGPAV